MPTSAVSGRASNSGTNIALRDDMEASAIRVLVVDDFEAWRHLVISTLRRRPWQIIGEAADGAEALQKAEELHPDVILMDIGLPALNGIEVARRIHKSAPRSRIVFLTENQSAEIVEEALCSGALGYVVKCDAASDLLPAVEAVLQGKLFVSTSVTVRGSSKR